MFYIRKYSGEKQRFDLEKFRRSLLKAGASDQVAQKISSQIQKIRPQSTHEVHEVAIQLLQQQSPAIANRYNLKRALMELGPAGFSFEQFMAQLLEKQGYSIKTNLIIPGQCIDHEVDIVAEKASSHAMIECKFHNRPGLKSDAKVVLYVQARFEDIAALWKSKPDDHHIMHEAWVITNTHFTQEAIKYAVCKNMKLIDWDYPEHNNLPMLITQYALFPITTLLSLSNYQKRSLLNNGLVLCKDIAAKKDILTEIGFKPTQIEGLLKEAHEVCNL